MHDTTPTAAPPAAVSRADTHGRVVEPADSLEDIFATATVSGTDAELAEALAAARFAAGQVQP